MRKFLAVLDDTPECINAIRFAALRAAHTGGGFQLLAIIAAGEIQHGFGVADVMRAEARARIESRYNSMIGWMRETLSIEPELVIREGELADELLAQLYAEPELGVVVLAASDDKAGPGPLITRLMREAGRLPCPLTIVPGEMTRERLEQIS